MRIISEVKCKVEFAEDTRFDVPIQRAIRTRAQWLQDILLLLRVRFGDRKRAPRSSLTLTGNTSPSAISAREPAWGANLLPSGHARARAGIVGLVVRTPH